VPDLAAAKQIEIAWQNAAATNPLGPERSASPSCIGPSTRQLPGIINA
jgi:hypothetical protein